MSGAALFWFMLASVEICPFVVYIAGRAMTRMDLGEPNPLVGYRTTLSMRNADTWQFANRDCGRRFRKGALWACGASALAMLLFLHGDEVALTMAVLCITGAQCAWVFIVIWQVQRDLHRVFNEDGSRRDNGDGTPVR